jgi:hypothetical protein
MSYGSGIVDVNQNILRAETGTDQLYTNGITDQAGTKFQSCNRVIKSARCWWALELRELNAFDNSTKVNYNVLPPTEDDASCELDDQLYTWADIKRLEATWGSELTPGARLGDEPVRQGRKKKRVMARMDITMPPAVRHYVIHACDPYLDYISMVLEEKSVSYYYIGMLMRSNSNLSPDNYNLLSQKQLVAPEYHEEYVYARQLGGQDVMIKERAVADAMPMAGFITKLGDNLTTPNWADSLNFEFFWRMLQFYW